jgi:hypothetical protein
MNASKETIEDPAAGERITFLETSEETANDCVVMKLLVAPGGRRWHRMLTRSRRSSSAWTDSWSSGSTVGSWSFGLATG